MTVKLIDHNRENEKTFETRSEAQEKRQDLIELGATREDLEIVATQEAGEEPAQADGGKTEVVDATVEADPHDYDLPEGGPSVDEDPLVWMPDEFTDTVDGTVTINRKGYEVLAHHYDVTGGTEMVVSPVETDMDYAVHKATVTDASGQEFTAFGEAHADDNGEENIVRMSDTRAYKRAVSRATGVGTVAIEELQSKL